MSDPPDARRPETRFHVTGPARADIAQILSWSSERFGPDARDRYRALIAAAFRDIAERRDEPGSVTRPELGPDVLTWHLRRSRARSTAGAVRQPRHLVVYRLDSDVVIIDRILHDAMDLRRHLDTP